MKFNTIEQEEEFVNLVSLNEKEIQKINISRCPLQLSKNKNMRAGEEDLQPSCNEKYKGYQKDKRFVLLNRKEIQKIGPLNGIEIQGKEKRQKQLSILSCYTEKKFKKIVLLN